MESCWMVAEKGHISSDERKNVVVEDTGRRQQVEQSGLTYLDQIRDCVDGLQHLDYRGCLTHYPASV
jgi:hypothetical protein